MNYRSAHERINQYSRAMFVIRINKTSTLFTNCTSSCTPHVGHERITQVHALRAGHSSWSSANGPDLLYFIRTVFGWVPNTMAT